MAQAKTILDRLPFVREFVYGRRLRWPPGHHHSPIVSPDEVRKHEDRVYRTPTKDLPGIDLHPDEQLQLLRELAQFYGELPFGDEPRPGLRYHFRNPFYSYADAILLYGMIRRFEPRRIIEVGSGYSSAVILDTNEIFFDNRIDLTFVEPYPETVRSLMKRDDEATIIEQPLQSVDFGMFGELGDNDFLFVDSTHVSKTGSDVNFLFFDVLPLLREGVKVHFHDIFHPFEYPREWTFRDNHSWNEAYLLRAFLMYNQAFRVRAFSTFLADQHADWFRRHMPLCLKNPGASIWIEKRLGPSKSDAEIAR